MSDQKGNVWVEVGILHITQPEKGSRGGAFLVDEHPSIWIPKSQIIDIEAIGAKTRVSDFEAGDSTKILIPEWLADKNELVGEPE